MAKFITLTKEDEVTPVFVNVESILYYYKIEDNDCTILVFSSHNDNAELLVREVPETIRTLIDGEGTKSEGSLPIGNFGEAMRRKR